MTGECQCGSGNWSYWLYDARGIELFKGCESCEDEKLRGYRPEVLTDSNYWHDEPIEEPD